MGMQWVYLEVLKKNLPAEKVIAFLTSRDCHRPDVFVAVFASSSNRLVSSFRMLIPFACSTSRAVQQSATLNFPKHITQEIGSIVTQVLKLETSLSP